MGCGVFTHMIADTPFAGAETGSRVKAQDKPYGQSLAAWRAEIFLSVFRSRPPLGAAHNP